jgi:hypothetical protein
VDSTDAWTDQHGDVVGLSSATGTALAGSAAYSPVGAVLASSGLQESSAPHPTERARLGLLLGLGRSQRHLLALRRRHRRRLRGRRDGRRLGLRGLRRMRRRL